LYSAYGDSSLKRSGMARVATHTFIHKWNEPHLPVLRSRRASPHYGRYSFSVPLKVEGWVGQTAGYKPRWFTRPQTVTITVLTGLGVK